LEGQLDSQATETAQSCSGVSRTVKKFASTPERNDPSGPTTQREEGSDGQPPPPIRTGGQARVLGEEKGEGTFGFVELGTADSQERVTDQ
jgi:hypothetical protein